MQGFASTFCFLFLSSFNYSLAEKWDFVAEIFSTFINEKHFYLTNEAQKNIVQAKNGAEQMDKQTNDLQKEEKKLFRQRRSNLRLLFQAKDAERWRNVRLLQVLWSCLNCFNLFKSR